MVCFLFGSLHGTLWGKITNNVIFKESILFEILFLGTSASAPSAKRGLSAQVIKHDEHRFLVDCGEGTQRQLLQSGTGFKNITKILLTHGHLDHILGLGGLLSTFLRWEAIDELDIFGGRATLDRVRVLVYDVVLRGNQPPMPLRLTRSNLAPSLKAMILRLPLSLYLIADLIVWDMYLRGRHAVPFCLKRRMNSESLLDLNAASLSMEMALPCQTVNASNQTMCWVRFKRV